MVPVPKRFPDSWVAFMIGCYKVVNAMEKNKARKVGGQGVWVLKQMVSFGP